MFIEKLLGEHRDSGKENSLCRELRKLPEEQRLAEIMNYLHNSVQLNDCSRTDLALMLANRSIDNPEMFQKLLQVSMEIADASTMQFWIKWICPRVGMDRFLHFLIQNADTHPKEIDYAVYWLRQKFLKRFASKNSMILFEQLVNLNSCDMHGRELCAQADYELF